MFVSKVSVKRPVTTLMFMLIAVLLGLVSLGLLPVDLYPQIEVPVAVVSVDYKGVAPEEMETLVTKPLEQSLSTLSNLKEISSYSREGNSVVVVQFEYGIDMDFAALEMREKVDLVKNALPDDSENPLVLKIDPNAQPIVQLGVSANMPVDKLQQIVEDEIQSKFERIEGVAAVNTFGGNEKEVKVVVDPDKLSGYGLSLAQIQGLLRSENLNLPGGRVKKGDLEYLLRTTGEFKTVEEISEMPIPLQTGEVIRLYDIANVTMKPKEENSISRLNGKTSIGVSITKQSVANTVKVAEKVNAEVKALQKEYPNLEIVVGSDTSEFINKSISNVTSSAISGGLLAIVILFLFLRNVRSTFIVGIAIPVSIISTFALMYFGNLSINLISLGGLALGVGMLVDNSIVVLENIYRLREEGMPIKEAAMEGAKEVGMAVTASTMTTVAVFLPIVFVKGFTSIVFKQFSFAVTCSLLASLAISLTVVPMMASIFLEVGEQKVRSHKGFHFGHLMDIFGKAIDGLGKTYSNFLKRVLRHKKLTVIVAFGIFVGSIFLVGAVGSEFFPKEDEGTFTVTINTPFGTDLEEVDRLVKRAEDIVEVIPEKEKIFTRVGGEGSFSLTANKTSEITVMLKDIKDRKRSTEEIVEEVRAKVKEIAGADIEVTEASSMGGGGPESAPISIELKGDDLEVLKKIAGDFEAEVKSVPGTSQVGLDVEEGDPEIRIAVNRKVASAYGITASDIANSLRSAVEGSRATTFKTEGDEIDVTVSMDESVKSSVENMKQIKISAPTGDKVPLGDLAEIGYGNSPTQIKRINQVRTININSAMTGRDLGSVIKDIESKISDYPLPSGYSYRFTGQQKEMQESFSGLILAFGLSIIIVYMILASQFESLIHPFTVMLTVPFALSGAFMGLFISQRALSVPAFIGIIMLAGIVVNNAIVLVDFINQRLESGMKIEEAIINAGETRLRPILMTTLTTVLGLIPLALGIGEGAQTQAPLATVVIGGLSLSTVLTLVFIPVVYMIFYNMSNFIRKKRKKA